MKKADTKIDFTIDKINVSGQGIDIKFTSSYHYSISGSITHNTLNEYNEENKMPPTSPSKTLPSSFLASTLLNQQIVQVPPLFRQSPPSILVFREPTPLKVGFFKEPPKY